MTSVSFTIPEIETERLRLRLPRMSDLEVHAAFRASDKAEFLGGPHDAHNAFQHLACNIGQWHLMGYGRWTIADRITDEPLGYTGLIGQPGPVEPELAWVAYLGHEGKGIAFEAATAARDFAYRSLGWTRLVSMIADGNTRSEALARRMGCVNEGSYEHPYHGGVLNVWRHPSPRELGHAA